MASNPYVNKVDLANGTTLIDLSTDTATQADVAQGKYFHLPTGERVQGTASGGGGTGGIYQDQNGYLVLSPDGDFPTLITKTITQNGTYDAEDDNADGYSSVTVNVSGGGGSDYTTANITLVNTTQYILNEYIPYLDSEYNCITAVITLASYDSADYPAVLYKGELFCEIIAPNGFTVSGDITKEGLSNVIINGAGTITIS